MAAPGDDWYDSEESTRLGMIVEVQRIRRRLRARPIPVVLAAIAVTALITYKLATRATQFEAEVVLALTEGSLSQKHSGVPVDDLREFVDGVLLPNSKLLELIERRDLYKLRTKLGNEFAIRELRDQLDIRIWKNTFISDEETEEHSARIGLTVTDGDPDRAFDLARDLATVVIQTAQEQREETTKELTEQVAEVRERLRDQFDRLARQTSEKEQLEAKAKREGKSEVVQTLELELAVMWHEQKKAEAGLKDIASSRDSLAGQISAAGLDMSVTVVEEHRPPRPEHRSFILAMIGVVVAIGSLLGAALVLGAFDSRVHDADDVERLGIAVLGHLPGFAGDHVGSLQARGVARARVPSFWKWRSHR